MAEVHQVKVVNEYTVEIEGYHNRFMVRNTIISSRVFDPSNTWVADPPSSQWTVLEGSYWKNENSLLADQQRVERLLAAISAAKAMALIEIEEKSNG